MNRAKLDDAIPAAGFGRRKVVPRACIVEAKPHIRNFLHEALEEIGFIARGCDAPGGLADLVVEHQSDLVVLGLSAGGLAANAALDTLQEIAFGGRVLVFGPAGSPMVTAIHLLGAEMGLAMLPVLPTPFSDRDLRGRVKPLLPKQAVSMPVVDVGEALHGAWLELWYQPKIDVRSLTIAGAEALIRMRHPTWGLCPPDRFLPAPDDPHFFALSEFVVACAAGDWRTFLDANGPLPLAVNLPLTFFAHGDAVAALAERLPRHPAFAGLVVEIEAADVMRHPALAQMAARQLQLHNIGVALDNVGTDWPRLLECDAVPFTELKIERGLIGGLANDRLKQTTCRSIVDFAEGCGARAVAQGIETRADFVAARELGFDLVQGFYFAKPMEPQKFSRRVLGKPVRVDG